MSCVAWWNTCTNVKCKNETYDRYRESTCKKCGSDNNSLMEWDEKDDYARDEYDRKHGRCTDEYGDDCPEDEEGEE